MLNNKKIFLPSFGKHIAYSIDDIIYLVADNHYTNLYSVNNKKEAVTNFLPFILLKYRIMKILQIKFKFIIICLLLLFSIKGFSQNKYYYFVNKAELKIIDSTYNEALQYYLDAFKESNHAFAKDYYNTVLCAVSSNEYKCAFQFIDSLVVKGFPLSFFNNDKNFELLRKEKEWQSFEKSFDLKSSKAEKQKNIKIRNEIGRIFDIDQKMANKRRMDMSFDSAFTYTVFSNIRKICSIINEIGGYPSEDVVGTNTLPFGDKLYFPILHYYNLLNRYPDSINCMKEPLSKAVQQIRFPLKTYVSLSNAIEDEDYKYGNLLKIQINDSILNIEYTDEYKKIINQNRADVGLESFEDYCKKVKYKQKNLGLRDKKKEETPQQYSEYLTNCYNNKATGFVFTLGTYTNRMFFRNDEEANRAFNKIKSRYKSKNIIK